VVGDGGIQLPHQAQRHAQIVVQLGIVGLDRQQAQIGADRLLEPAGALRRRRQPHLLLEAFVLVAEQHMRLFGRRDSDVTVVQGRVILHGALFFPAKPK